MRQGEVDQLLTDGMKYVEIMRCETERAAAIHELRKCEGRTFGRKRRDRLTELAAGAERIRGALAEMLASHHDPVIVREAARFERRRALGA